MASAYRYLSYDLVSNTRLGEIPYRGVSFGSTLNTPGAFGAQVPMTDPSIVANDAVSLTHPGRTALFVDYNGSIVWGGIIWTRRYNKKSGTLTIAGNEFASIFSQRIIAQDYSQNPATSIDGTAAIWNATPDDPTLILAQVLYDAANVKNPSTGTTLGSSIGLQVLINNAAPGSPVTPGAGWIAPSWPITSLQTLASILGSLTGMGYEIGFDYGTDCAWVAGSPVKVLNISYPRRGLVGSASGLYLDLGSCDDYDFNEDATAAGSKVYATGSSSGGVTIPPLQDAVPVNVGYPLLEQVVSNSAVTDQGMLEAVGASELALYDYPAVTIDATFAVPPLANSSSAVPAFPDLGDFKTGDDFLVVVQPSGGSVPPDYRFPSGMSYVYRLVQWAVTVPDGGGRSTVVATFNIPPALTPAPPPIGT